MNDFIERFTLECRTNKSLKSKKFKPKSVSKNNYEFWKADSNVMFKDVILAYKAKISYPRQMEMIHGAIERILKSFIIKEYGMEVMVHELVVIAESINQDLNYGIDQQTFTMLKLLDTNFILYRYPSKDRIYEISMIKKAMEVLIGINTLINEELKVSNRAKERIKSMEEEISISKI